MIISGGQMGVALGYATAPLVLWALFTFLNVEKKRRWHQILLVSLLFGLQMWFDIRLSYITAGIMLFFLFIAFVSEMRSWARFRALATLIPYGFIGILFVFLLHAFWILPLLISRIDPAAAQGAVYTSQNTLQFFSFADFSHAISLLHANWPENIFGKTYFLQPEFLVLPILAYGSLLFLGKAGSITYYVLRNKDERKVQKSESQNRYILFFALLGLLGAFLAKGANPPFGGVYIWLFDHVPGFVMFRDASKFYAMTAISYSVLIPFTIGMVSKRLYESRIAYIVLRIRALKNPSIIYLLFSGLFLIFWAFTIRQAVTGQVGGLLKSKTIEQDFTTLKNLLISEGQYIRTLAIPTRHRFIYFSTNFPSIDGASVLETSSISAQLAWFRNDTAREQLARWAVKYVVVPTDPEAEIFLKDRKYDPSIREHVLQGLRAIPWFKERTEFGALGVFETAGEQNHFWLEDRNGNTIEKPILSTVVDPTRYDVSVGPEAAGTRLVFSESFDTNWMLVGSGNTIRPQSTEDGLNSFPVPTETSFTIVYAPQKLVGWGTKVSLATFVVLILILKRRQRQLSV